MWPLRRVASSASASASAPQAPWVISPPTATAGGVTSLVCPPDTDPVLDEPGLVEMLKFRARKLSRCRVFPLGALTRGLQGTALTEMAELTEAGCVGFSQVDAPVRDTLVLLRALHGVAVVVHHGHVGQVDRPGHGQNR